MLTGMAAKAQAQNAVAVSSNPGPALHIALNWDTHATGVKYNIFRRNETDATYPGTPLNASPVVILSSCPAIKTLLITSPDSVDWKIVAKALSGPGPGLFNPCVINTLAHSSEKYKRLQVLAKSSMPIAIAAGLGYRDNTVTNGKTYFYKIVALNAANAVVGTVATDLKVTAGSFIPLPPPASVAADAGDDAVLVRWDPVIGSAGYIVERAPSAAGIFRRVNESTLSVKVTKKLNGDTVIPSQNGMQDYKRYTFVHGKDSTHVVNGIAIDGPKNNNDYYYRISTLDLFNRAGTVSVVSNKATPKDSTSPSVPIDLAATSNDVDGTINVRWTQVVKDINAHWEYPDSSIRYKLYRFTTSEDPNSHPSTYLGEVGTVHGLKSRDTTDADPNLRGTFGNRTWWYRLKSKDIAGNISQWSTAVSAIIKDITPPGIVKNLVTKGFEEYISVKWQPNSEPDMASYMVYRSLCHLGSWIDCSKQKDTCKTWQSYDPSTYFEEKDGTKPNERDAAAAATGATGGYRKLPCPCSGTFVFLGEITKDSVNRAINAGNFFFNDRTIPAGSPLCYAYWIKAKDSSDNIGGSFPVPSPAEQAEIKCERLRDRTPPEPAIIAGVFAQAEQIRVEWIGPPTQDTRAYHVYRAEGKDPAKEPKTPDYSWVGGMTVELPPTMPKVLTAPYTPPGLATCDKISVQATPWMSQGFFEDKTVKPKLTYWYKVVGIDYDGNETKLDKAAAISTFSFTRKIPDAPVIVTIDKQATPCGVVLKWSPPYNPADQIGFIVYRSEAAAGPFIPVVTSPVKANEYTDTNVIKGKPYWYKVALMMSNGRLSALSAVQTITP